MDQPSANGLHNGNGAETPVGVARGMPPRVVSDAPEAFGSGESKRAPEAFGRGRAPRDGSPDGKANGSKRNGDDGDSANGEDSANDANPQAREKQKAGDNDKHAGDEKQDQKDGEKGGGHKNDAKDKPKRKPFYKRPVVMTIIIVALLVLVVGGVLYYFYSRQYEGTDDAYIDVHEVPISPQVSAQLQAVHVTDNQPVKKGDLMVELDPTNFQVVLDQKLATLQAQQSREDQARAELAVAQANIGEAQAEVDVAQTNADNADRDYKRFMSLQPRARSQQQVDNATAAYKGNHAQVEQAQAKLESMKAQMANDEVAVKTAMDTVKQAKADVDQARTNLGYCTISAPVDGLVTKLGIQAGSYATAGEVFFSIVPTDVYITANYKETQLTYMNPGQPVTIKIDAYPGREWHGHVDSIQNGSGSRFSLMPPENATGNYVKVVQRVPVKIDLDAGQDRDPDGHLLEPGLSVEPTVKVR